MSTATTPPRPRKPRRRELPPLVGRAEAAEILGVHPNNMHKMKGVPEPTQTLRATPVWPRDVIEWARDVRAHEANRAA